MQVDDLFGWQTVEMTIPFSAGCVYVDGVPFPKLLASVLMMLLLSVTWNGEKGKASSLFFSSYRPSLLVVVCE